jgi:thymidylate synthase ThyX
VTVASVQLVNVFDQAYDNFVATARTCYSGKGLVTPEDVTGPPDAPATELELRRQRKNALAQSLFKAGHHTTLQHAHVQFALDRVSRHFIWSFLHAHPFYNSEQVSQRYVAVKEENFYAPRSLGGAALEKYLKCVRAQMAAYQHLSEMLRPVVAEEYYGRFKGRYGTKRADVDIKKRAQEAARYVLPVATYAYLYHTVSVITLMRYYRICQQFDTPTEQREVIGTMVEALLSREPEFGVLLQEPLDLESTPEYAWFAQRGAALVDTGNARAFVSEFDSSLNGATSVLVDYGARSEQAIASSVREVLGLPAADLCDADALAMVLDPSRNALLGESMNLTTLGKISRTMFHAHYVFRKVLSHAADSQDQRHRMTPASRPVLMRHYTGEPDFVTPAIIQKDPAVLARYEDSMRQTWSMTNDLLAAGVSREDASYLLPNAVKVRFTESGDLLNLHHKMAMRLCYNAQEEIWKASLDEARAITSVHPAIGQWLLPPCGLRKHAGQKPICPEGDRYCGVPVWRLNRDEYSRVI